MGTPIVAPPPPPQSMREETLWHGSPSWLLLLGKLIVLVLCAVVLPILLYYAASYANGIQERDTLVKWGWMIIAVILLLQAIVVAIAYARIRTTLYKVTNQRVQIETGIADKKVEDIDLRYIEDTQFRQRLIERMLGIGNVTLVSSDKTSPVYVLRGLSDPRGIRELIRARAYEVSQRQLFTRQT